MRRTGANRRHLRKFIVRGEDGYKRPVAEARITDEGEFVFTGDPAYAPSAEEKEKIEAWAKEAKWPKSIPASMAEAKHQIEIIVKEAKHECECILFLDDDRRAGDSSSRSASTPTTARRESCPGPTGTTASGDAWSRTGRCRCTA